MLEALVFSFFLECGWVPDQGVYLPESTQEVENLLYAELGAELQYGVLFAAGSVRTYIEPTADWNVFGFKLWPHRADYKVALGSGSGDRPGGRTPE